MSSKRDKMGTVLFNKSFKYIYMTIFSYIPKNKDVFNFSMCNKSLCETFFEMLSYSSVRLHRLRVLNKIQRRDYTFDIFHPYRTFVNYNLKNLKFYVTSLEEYKKSFQNLKIIKVLERVNEKYPRSCFISGSFALVHFLKKKRFDLHFQSVARRLRRNYKLYNFLGFGYTLRRVLLKNHVSKDLRSDIDIFILGKDEKQKEVIKYLLGEMEKDFEDHEIFHRCSGLYEIYGKEETILPHEFSTKVPKFQIIAKDLQETPADVFSFFDLDICKIGYFPYHKEVRSCVSFLRAISKRINYSDFIPFRVGKKHIDRIDKYFVRTLTYTSAEIEPHLSSYHSFNKLDFSERVVNTVKKNDTQFENGETLKVNKKIESHVRDFYTNVEDVGSDEENQKELMKLATPEELKVLNKERSKVKKKEGFRKIMTIKGCLEFLDIDVQKGVPYLTQSVGIVKKEGLYLYQRKNGMVCGQKTLLTQKYIDSDNEDPDAIIEKKYVLRSKVRPINVIMEDENGEVELIEEEDDEEEKEEYFYKYFNNEEEAEVEKERGDEGQWVIFKKKNRREVIEFKGSDWKHKNVVFVDMNEKQRKLENERREKVKKREIKNSLLKGPLHPFILCSRSEVEKLEMEEYFKRDLALNEKRRKNEEKMDDEKKRV